MNTRSKTSALIALAVVLGCTSDLALAQTAVQGKPAPANVVNAAQGTASVRIGAQALRAVPEQALPKEALTRKAGAVSTQTFVMRESDNLVGVSLNDLMVVGPDLERMAASVKALGLPGIEINIYPDIGLLLVRTQKFEQLQLVHDRLAGEFAQARFDVPVNYFPRKRQ